MWIEYTEKSDWTSDKIILLELISKGDGRVKYESATVNNGKIMVVGGHFLFDMKQIYSITKYLLIDKP